jgi:hypothetical protein
VGFPLPFTPPITTGGPHLPTVDDALVKDKKVRASTLIRDHSGWRGTNAQVARGVMGAESGFNPDADNGTCCIGLMQMNLNHAGSYGIPEGQDAAKAWLKDPVNNVESAYKLWKATGWKPTWDTVTNGKYKLHIHEDPLISLKSSLSSGVVDTVKDAAGVFKPLDELASTLLSSDTWFRIGKGVVGWDLVIVGVAGLGLIVAVRVSKAPPVRAALKVAKKIPPI